MSNPVGESLPEPDPEPSERYFKRLFLAYDRHDFFPAYSNYANIAKEFDIRSFDDNEGIAIEASIYGKLAEKYVALDAERQFELADRVERSIGAVASRLSLIDSTLKNKSEPIVLINYVPVMFEPIHNAMLVGKWEGRDRTKMNIQSRHVESRQQQRLLIGGFASFVSGLEKL